MEWARCQSKQALQDVVKVCLTGESRQWRGGDKRPGGMFRGRRAGRWPPVGAQLQAITPASEAGEAPAAEATP